MPQILVIVALAATNLMSSSIVYQAPYQPIQVVMEKAEEVKLDKTLEAIIKCESRGNPNAVNLNRNGTRDWGVFQVNDVHRKRMSEMGLNIENPDHSYQFGLLLYKEQGVAPWFSSRHCWSKMVE
jgi:hypothetical protein